MPRSVRLAAALIALLAIAGCTQEGGASRSALELAGDRPPLAELQGLDDPRSYEGPSTALLGDASIAAVTADPDPQLPATVVDNQQTEVTVASVDRILALDVYGSLSATVQGLGLGGNLVGRDTSTTFAEAAELPLVTANGHELSAEAILQLDPTVIITDTTLGPWDVVLQLRESGIPVVVTDSHRDLDNVTRIVDQVSAALGVEEEGRMLAERIEGEIAATVAAIDDLAPDAEADRLRVAFLYVRGNAGVYYLFGEDSGADSLIESLGAIDIASEIDWRGMRPVNAEALVEMAPDLILMMTKGLESVDGVDGLLERVPAVASTPAGAHRRIVDMDDGAILGFGPRTPEVLDALARAIYAPESA
jgi:iron complex transport system substrate-binding protein